MKHLKTKTLPALRRAGDIWTCPGCGVDNIHSIYYIEQVLLGRGLVSLLEKNHVKALEDLPMASGSSFETVCGACHNSFAPRQIGGRRNPILHPAYTHEEDWVDGFQDRLVCRTGARPVRRRVLERAAGRGSQSV